jgi:hypothetical protein
VDDILIVMSEGFVDYCPSIKPGDEKYGTAQSLVKKSGCYEENLRLTDCLNEHRKNFAQCQVKYLLYIEIE